MKSNTSVVQGQHAMVQPFTVAEPVNEFGETFNGEKGSVQPPKFNDVFFGVLFYAHLIALLCVVPFAIGYDNNNNNNNAAEIDLGQITYFVGVCCVFAVGMSTLALGFMMKFSRQLVKISLVFGCFTSFAVMILLFGAGSVMGAVFGAISFAVTLCYTCAVWNRVAFAAANLNTALSAVRSNLGLSVVAYALMIVAAGYSLMWTFISNAVLDAYPAMAFLMLLSYFWTHQVLSNTMHATCAGVIGTWWFAPVEASAFCSPSIKDSFVRSTTYSFGSICFGSLIVAVIQTLRHLQNQLRHSDDDSMKLIGCIIQCILACIEDLIEYFNEWAYIYVGLYGYSYLDAGRNVIQLFQAKGWTTIISDSLAARVLGMISLVIGLFTGLVGFIMASLDQNIFADYGFDNSSGIGFLFGFLVGLILASIFLGIVDSAVKTCIVCFAESPAEFEQNHPQLSLELRDAWRSSWPEIYA